MNIRKYLSLTRNGILESLHFRLSMFVMIIGNILYLIVVYFLWKAIYESSGTDVVNGMTFTDTLIYLVLATALFNFMEMYFVWEMGRNIQSGKIVLDLIKPMEYRNFLFWEYSGTYITNFLFSFLPTFIIVSVVTGGAIHFGMNLVYFILSVILAISINYSIDFFVGTICLYTESIWGINIMKQVVVLLFSGATIPIAFFPETLKNVAYALPFQSIFNAPLSLLLSDAPDTALLTQTFGLQIFWVVFMFLLDKVFWKFSLRKITVNGG